MSSESSLYSNGIVVTILQYFRLMKKSVILIVLLVFVLKLSTAQEDSVFDGNKSALLWPPVIQEEIIHSDYVNDDYRIMISLPSDYNEQRGERYPVIYFLDGGGTSFHDITAEYMDYSIIPDVITIGIGYPGETKRNRDYTYSFSAFYDFLKYELIPHIDGNYHTDSLKRTLYGHSFGGLCVLQTLFMYTDYNDIPFRNLIAASPSIWWPDGRKCFLLEEDLSYSTSILPVNLYMTMGSLEGSMVDDYFRMSDALDSRNYEFFTSSYHLNQNKDHSTNKEHSFREGIKWALRQKIFLPPKDPTSIPGSQSIQFIAYPNPVNDILTVDLMNNFSKQVQIEILDFSGKSIFHSSSSASHFKLNVSEFPQGIYLLKVDGDKLHSCTKIRVN
jgi:predicted alpha/beta superfamily hydrolase